MHIDAADGRCRTTRCGSADDIRGIARRSKAPSATADDAATGYRGEVRALIEKRGVHGADLDECLHDIATIVGCAEDAERVRLQVLELLQVRHLCKSYLNIRAHVPLFVFAICADCDRQSPSSGLLTSHAAYFGELSGASEVCVCGLSGTSGPPQARVPLSATALSSGIPETTAAMPAAARRRASAIALRC